MKLSAPESSPASVAPVTPTSAPEALLTPAGSDGIHPLSLRPSLTRASSLPPWAAPFFASVPALLLGAVLFAGQPGMSPVTTAPTVVAQQADDTQNLLRLPESRTLLVRREITGGSVVLRGRIQENPLSLTADTTSTAGIPTYARATVNGMVARVYAQPGQTVQAGQKLVEISTGTAVRPAPRAERAQTAAEQAQVRAAHQQEGLDTRLADAQTRLTQAQQRVQQAQARVDQARQVVRGLQARGASGDTASSDTAPADTPTATNPADTAPSGASTAPDDTSSDSQDSNAGRDTAAQRAAQRERDSLLREARRLDADAEDATMRAQRADDDADKAEAEARTTKAKIADLQVKAQAMQKAFDAGGAKGSDVEAARAAVEDAQNDAAEASTQAVAARQDADRLKAKAVLLRVRSQSAKDRAMAALRKLQLFADAPASPPRHRKPRLARVPRSDSSLPPVSGNMTIQDAARLVKAAVADSEAALADSHRIQHEVDDYQARVASTTRNIKNSSQDLRDAQNRVLATGVRPTLTAIYAPVTGQVRDIARLTQSVAPGDAVVTVLTTTGGSSTTNRSAILEARLIDTSGVSRTLHPGTALPALLIAPQAPGNPPSALPPTATHRTTVPGSKAAPAPQTKPAALPRAVPQHALPQHVVPQHKVTHPAANDASHLQLPPHRVAPGQSPASPPKAATGPFVAPAHSPSTGVAVMLRVRTVTPPAHPGAPAVVSAALEASTGEKGASVLCSVPKPGGRSAMRVPVSAIWHAPDGQAYVAVLRDLSEAPVPLTTAPLSLPPTAVTPPSTPTSMPPSTASGVPLPSSSPAMPPTVPTGEMVEVEWRQIVTGAGDGVQQEILHGLEPRERIALEPRLLLAPQDNNPGGPNSAASPDGDPTTPDADTSPENGDSESTEPSPNGTPQQVQPHGARRVLLVRL